MVIYNDYLLESTEYALYKCNKDIDNVITSMKLQEANILANANELLNEESTVILEFEIIDKIKTSLFGAAKSGRYDLVRPQIIKSIHKMSTDQLDAIEKGIPDIIANLESQIKQNQKFEDQINEHIKWIKTDLKKMIKERRLEIKHNISETGMTFAQCVEAYESGDYTLDHVVESCRYDLIRPNLLNIARTAKTVKEVKSLKDDLSRGVKSLTELAKKTSSFYKDNINEHINWLKTDYTMVLDDRRKELVNVIRESVMEDIIIVQEAAKDRIKSIIETLINKIKEIWAKFFGTKASKDANAKWLLDNKAAILAAKYKGSEELPELWKTTKFADNIINKIPKLDYSKMKPSLASDDTFISQYLNDIYEDGKSYQDVLRSKLYSDKRVVLKDTQVPINDMFNYCTNGYKQLFKDLENVHNECIRSAEQFKNDIMSGKINVNESAVCFERYFYSYLQEAVIYEEDLGKTVEDNSQNTTSNDNKQEDNKQQEDKKQESDQEKEKSEQQIKAQKDISRYITINTNIKGIVMKYLNDCFDTYFSILKKHAKANNIKYKVEKEKKDNNKKEDEDKKKEN